MCQAPGRPFPQKKGRTDRMRDGQDAGRTGSLHLWTVHHDYVLPHAPDDSQLEKSITIKTRCHLGRLQDSAALSTGSGNQEDLGEVTIDLILE